MKDKILGAAVGAVVGFAASFGGPIVVGIGIGAIGSTAIRKIAEHHKAKKDEEVIFVPEEEVAAAKAAEEAANA